MNRVITFAIISLMMAMITIKCTSDSQSKTYYVSPNGNDENAGLSENAAWKTIERLNSVVFQPGDVMLFESGGVWNGQLRPQGKGEPGKPITIGSYGGGARPVINIKEAEGAAIHLVNQSWLEIKNIEITSGAQPKLGIGRQGIVVLVEGEGNHVQHIVIRDCYIHDIWGQLSTYKNSAIFIGQNFGINTEKDCSINDVLIENNRIERVDKCGIIVFMGLENIIVRKNVMGNLGGDGIIVVGSRKGIVEYNIADRTCLRTGDPYLNTGEESRYSWWPHTAALWLAGCTETVMQFNEVYNTGRQPANGDGLAYDFDFGCKNCVLQYNYSQNNAGFLLIMDKTFRNIARYNISENDVKFRPTHLISMFCDTTEQNLIHNNVFYVDHGTSDIDCYYGDEYGPKKGKGLKDKSILGAQFRNNIFYATGQGRFRIVFSRGDSLNSAEFRKLDASVKLPPPVHGTKFFHNCYFGPWMNGLPDDPEKLLADPMFVAAGSGGIGFSTLNGYKLQVGSPCINAGVFIAMDRKRDFYGSPVNDGTIDIGVYEKNGQ
jgi:hypothetical protein